MESAQNYKDQKKPTHPTQSLLDQFMFKKVRLDEKTPNNSQDYKKIPIDTNPPPNLNPIPQSLPPITGYYVFPHTKANWPRIELKLKLMSEGKTSLEQNLTIVEANLAEQMNMKSVDISILKKYIQSLDSNTKTYYKETIFPCITKLSLKTGQLFTNNSIPLFSQGIPQKVTLSKEQCACMLANMCLGLTLPQKGDKLCRYHNFYYWYKRDAKNEKVLIEKIKCLFNYFVKISQGIPEAYLRFHRLVLDRSTSQLSNWKNCTKFLESAILDETGKIEDSKDAIEVDFANLYLGGLALTAAVAQEEIIFTVSPECLVGVIFNDYMREDEGILIQGAETYSNHSGYRDFKFVGPNYDIIPITADKVLNREILAIDAINLRDSKSPEYTVQGVLRDLNKAYIGFNAADDLGKMTKKKVATGRWGCGVFKANVQLKFLIQWVAASRAERDMIFYSFGDAKVKNSWKVVNKYTGKTVGDVVKDMLEGCEFLQRNKGSKKDLFTFMLEK